jgi:hypothetical protein
MGNECCVQVKKERTMQTKEADGEQVEPEKGILERLQDTVQGVSLPNFLVLDHV